MEAISKPLRMDVVIGIDIESIEKSFHSSSNLSLNTLATSKVMHSKIGVLMRLRHYFHILERFSLNEP